MTEPRGIVVPRIVGNEITLRGFEDGDIAAVLEASADAGITSVTSVPTVAETELAEQWIARQHGRTVDGSGYSLAIQASGECVGQIGLWLREIDQGRATIGYWIRPSRRGRGFAFRALGELSRWAWQMPELHRLQLHIDPANEASVRTAERAGYVREGLLRSWQEIRTERRDMLVYSLIRTD